MIGTTHIVLSPLELISIDACQCECDGRMKIVAAVTDPASVRRYTSQRRAAPWA